MAITTGESSSPQEIPRAVKLTFAILASVYLGAIVVLVGVMPWDRAGVTESPFVTVFRHAHVPAAPHIMTFVILTAALSGANAALYAASRVLFSLARTGWAPAVLGRLNASGSPKLAVLASSYGIVVALVLEKWAPKNAFVSILGAALVGMLLSWLVSLAAHIQFRRKLSTSQLGLVAHALPSGSLGLGAGIRAHHCGSPGDRLELSLNTDQRRRVHDRADRGLFPAEKEVAAAVWGGHPRPPLLSRDVLSVRTLSSCAKKRPLQSTATTKNQMQQRRTRVSVPHELLTSC